MEHSRGSADSLLIGLYTMFVDKDENISLEMDDEVLAELGLETGVPPEQTYRTWISAVHEEYRPFIKNAVRSCIAGLQAEVRFLWEHPQIGLTRVTCVGVLSDKDSERAVIKGFFRLLPFEQQDTPTSHDRDAEIYKRMLADAIMDNYAVCALFDTKTNELFFLRDDIISDSPYNSMTFDEWREIVLPMIFQDDADKFRRATSRDAMQEMFERNSNSFHLEVRFLDPKTNTYKRLKQRFFRFAQPMAGRFGECMMFSEIRAGRNENFREIMRRRLIDGLALPYRELDLINLKTGTFFSSKSRQGEYTENFEEIGNFDDALVKYLDACDLTEEERAENMDKFSTKNLVKRFRAGEKLIESELRHRREADGLYEWVRVQAFQSAADEERMPYMAIFTAMPINAEKEKELQRKQVLEKALRNQRQFKKAILSNAMAVYTYNVTNDIIYEEIVESENIEPLLPKLGLSVPCSYNEYIERKSKGITIEEEAERFRRTFNTKTLIDLFNSKRYTFDCEYEYTIDGMTGVFRETFILTKDMETGDIWGLTTVRNIKNERDASLRIEQALRDAYNHANNANNAKTRFMSQMSHDIRTPLNSILGMSAIARENTDNPERIQECLDKIDYAGRHLLEVINNVLDLSAIESGKTELAEEEFDLGEFISNMIEMVTPLANKRHHHLEVNLGEMHENVAGDPTKLRQLLVNVLSNAIKYTPDGGEIGFTAVELEPDRHDVCHYMFTVSDNGIGMSEELCKRVFDPFIRADDRRIGNVQGTGLGMTIALNIARMMNGDITVLSEEGKGSVFEITVCLKRGEEHISRHIGEIVMTEPKKVRMSDYDFGGRRVLLAEDLSFNAEIAEEFLSAANIKVDIASNGAEAVKMFSDSEEGRYSMIFMDIQMPELDGNSAARKIRELERPDAKTIPIIAMTANAFMEDIKAAEDAGMNAHIAKPIEVPNLVRELTRFFGNCRKEETV